jgi:hypothetical protein
MEICIEYQNLIKIGKKCGTLYMETEIHFSVAGAIKAPSSREIVSDCFDSRRTRRHFTAYVYFLSFYLLPTTEYVY